MDELPELEEIYAANPNLKTKVPSTLKITTPQNLPAESPSCSTAIFSTLSDDATPWTPPPLYSGTQIVTSRSKRRRTNESEASSFHSSSQTTPGRATAVLPYYERNQSIHDSSTPREDPIDSLLKAAELNEQSDNPTVDLLDRSGQTFDLEVQQQPDTPGVWPHASIQEACLMR